MYQPVIESAVMKPDTPPAKSGTIMHTISKGKLTVFMGCLLCNVNLLIGQLVL